MHLTLLTIIALTSTTYAQHLEKTERDILVRNLPTQAKLPWPWNQIYSPFLNPHPASRTHISQDKESDSWKLFIEAKNLNPDELVIKVKGKDLLVQTNKTSGDGDSFIESHYTRIFLLPHGVDPETVKAYLSKEVLYITFPNPKEVTEKIVPIEVVDKINKDGSVVKDWKLRIEEIVLKEDTSEDKSESGDVDTKTEVAIKRGPKDEDYIEEEAEELTNDTVNKPMLTKSEDSDETSFVNKIKKKDLKSSVDSSNVNDVTKKILDGIISLDYALKDID